MASQTRHERLGYAKFRSRSHHAVVRVYDEAGNVMETHEHKGEFRIEFTSPPALDTLPHSLVM
jgi:hypothetical protein